MLKDGVFVKKDEERLMEEEMSTYTFIIESEVCNTGFEIGLGFFSKVFPVQGCVQWCFTAVFFTL